ncbi:MAG: phosphopantothenoylcysteine decarboxylase, partial [Spirochaetia bacterium]
LAGVPVEYVDTAEEMTEEIERLLESEHTDCFIAAAAVGDWKPAETHKEELSPHSKDSISLKFLPTTRIIDRIKEKFPHTYIVAFMEDSEGRKEFENGHGGASIYGGGKTSAEDSKNLPDSRRTQANADLIALDNARGGIHVFSRQGRKYHIPFSEEFKAAERLVDIVSQLMNE